VDWLASKATERQAIPEKSSARRRRRVKIGYPCACRFRPQGHTFLGNFFDQNPAITGDLRGDAGKETLRNLVDRASAVAGTA